MKVILKFDYEERVIFIPDGYVTTLSDLQEKFFLWLYEQPDNITSEQKVPAVQYDADDFLNYLNIEVLSDTNEKAYYLKTVDEKVPVLSF